MHFVWIMTHIFHLISLQNKFIGKQSWIAIGYNFPNDYNSWFKALCISLGKNWNFLGIYKWRRPNPLQGNIVVICVDKCMHACDALVNDHLRLWLVHRTPPKWSVIFVDISKILASLFIHYLFIKLYQFDLSPCLIVDQWLALPWSPCANIFR